MAERWHEGVWLGQCFRTGENFVALSGGDVVRARSVKERPSNTPVTMEMLNVIKHYPWTPTGVLSEGSRKEVARSKEQPDDERGLGEGPVRRGVKIRRQILEQVGYTEGCLKCRAMESRDEMRTRWSEDVQKPDGPSLTDSKRERINPKLIKPVPACSSTVQVARW